MNQTKPHQISLSTTTKKASRFQPLSSKYVSLFEGSSFKTLQLSDSTQKYEHQIIYQPNNKNPHFKKQLFSTSYKETMNPATKAWILAASIGAVEALKDQGICRWNYTMRSLHQHAKNNMRSLNQAKRNISSSSSSSNKVCEEMGCNKMKITEDSITKVMDLSCWGPSTVRF